MKIKLFKRTLVAFFVFCCSVFAIPTIKDNVSGDIDSEQFKKMYNRLCKCYNNENSEIKLFNKKFEDFENSILYPVHITSPSFLKISRKALRHLSKEGNKPKNSILYSLIEDRLIPKLSNRIDLARLDNNISKGFGSRKKIDNFGNKIRKSFFSLERKKALSYLTGRIFQVEYIDHNIDINKSNLLGTSSGLLIDWDNINFKINNLSANSNTALNSILTCAHSFSVEDGRAKAFFVPTKKLNLETGFPKKINDLHGSAGLIYYLENNKNSYPLNSLHIKDRKLNQWEKISLKMGQPQYLNNEDLVVGRINLSGKNILNYNEDIPISFDTNDINKLNCKVIFALGYPGCDHYDVNHLTANYLVQSEGIAPFFITSRLMNKKSNRFVVDVNVNGLIKHYSPCAPGMSGGSLFYLNKKDNGINIFGVITAGEDEDEQGCHWN